MNRLAAALLVLFGPLAGAEPSPAAGTTASGFSEPLEFSGTAEEDYFGFSLKEVSLSGHFKEDVWAAGRDVRFHGEAVDDARLASAELLTVDGAVGGVLYGVSGAGNILVSTNAVVRGAVTLEGNQRITLRGTFDDDVSLRAPRLVVESEIKGDLHLAGREIQLLPGTRIHGNLYNRGGRELPLPDGVEVLGERIQLTPEPSGIEQTLQRMKWIVRALQLFTSLVVGLLLIRLMPRAAGQSVDLLIRHRGPTLTIGLLATLAMGVGGYFLLFSFIGTGVGLFLLMAGGLLFYLGKILVALALGAALLRQRDSMGFPKLALALFLGLVVLYSVFSIAYIGTTIYLLVSCWGLGAILVGIRNSQQALRLHLPPELKKNDSTS